MPDLAWIHRGHFIIVERGAIDIRGIQIHSPVSPPRELDFYDYRVVRQNGIIACEVKLTGCL